MLLLVAAATTPWAVLGIAMLATMDHGTAELQVAPVGDDAHAVDEIASATAPTSGTDRSQGASESPSVGGSDVVARRPPDRRDGIHTGDVVPSDLAAAATVALRIELSELSDEAIDRRYVDAAAAEAVEQVGSVAVVRVQAIVMEGSGEGWEQPSVRRFAVPLVAAADAWVLAGRPWELPSTHRLAVHEPGWIPRDAPEETFESLHSAGYVGVSEVSAEQDPSTGLLRLSFHADMPKGGHEVWATTDPQLRLLGTASRAIDDQPTREMP